MNKIVRIMSICLNVILNTLILGAVVIILLWIFGNVSPQTSIVKTANFLSSGWSLITSSENNSDPKLQTSDTSLKKETDHIHVLN